MKKEKNVKMEFANSNHGGGSFTSSKQAFTLIELLAIIVILAIIAVITVPIILNVIDNAKKGSVIDSAYGYKDAIQKFYVEKLSENSNFKLDGTYKVEALKEMGLTVSGTEPALDSWVTITNNQVVDYSLKFDDYIVNYNNDESESIKNGTIKETVNPLIVRVVDNVKYYNTEWVGTNPVYYNPVKGGMCNRTSADANGTYTESNSDNKFKGTDANGCMKWYAYSENANGKINLLLDHNITENSAWVSIADYGSGISPLATSLGITYPNNTIVGSDNYGYGNWNKGPITLINQLKEDTKDWSGVLGRNDTYTNSNNYNGTYINGSYNSGNPTERFTINYGGYKARLITADEIAHITGASKATTNGGIGWSESTSSNNKYYFDSLTDSQSTNCTYSYSTGEKNISGCSYGWLYDRTSSYCTDYGCLNNSNCFICGYWTVSPDAGDSNYAWGVDESSHLNGNYVAGGSRSGSEFKGLRPVITIPKSVAFGS